MFRSRTLAAALLLLSLPIAAAAQNASADREMMRLLARPRQLLFPEELRGNCVGITIAIKTRIDRLRILQKQAKQEGAGPAPTLFGDRPAEGEFAKERERVEALNVVLDAKGCKPVNIDEELLRPAATPPPKQEKEHSAPATRRVLER
jgi:hypothetical protein